MDKNGILLIDKPQGFTSFDVVAVLRGVAKTRRVGHGGTLDPMATGVLPLFFGSAAKAADMLPNRTKRYRARFRLGVTTDTLDITGKILSRREVAAGPEQVRKAAEGFIGTIKQIPPMYSAVQVDGRRLYDLARKGIEVERPAREVEILGLELSGDGTGGEYTLDVHCSKGTYIRTLCADIGEKLGCGAVLTELVRTESAGFSLADCITLERARELGAEDKLDGAILPVDSAFGMLPEYTLSMADAKLHCNGVAIWVSRLQNLPEGDVRIYREDGEFLSVSRPDREKGQLVILKRFGGRESVCGATR